jgi:hypothetical protein
VLINKRLKIAKNYKVVMLGDEVSFDMWGSLSRTLALVGQQSSIKTTGIRKGCNDPEKNDQDFQNLDAKCQ